MIGKCESNINGATGHLEEPVEGPFQSSTAFRRSFLYNLSRNRLRFYQRHGNVNSLWAKWLASRICSRLRTKITKWHHRLPDSVSRNSILGLPAQSLLLSYLKWPLEALGNLWRGLFYGLAFNIVQRSGNKQTWKQETQRMQIREPRNFAQNEIGLLDWKKISTWEAPWSDELVSRSWCGGVLKWGYPKSQNHPIFLVCGYLYFRKSPCKQETFAVNSF